MKDNFEKGVATRISRAGYEKLEKLAKLSKRSKAWIMRVAVEQFVEKNRDQRYL